MNFSIVVVLDVHLFNLLNLKEKNNNIFLWGWGLQQYNYMPFSKLNTCPHLILYMFSLPMITITTLSSSTFLNFRIIFCYHNDYLIVQTGCFVSDFFGNSQKMDGLCRTWLETPKTGFVVTWLTLSLAQIWIVPSIYGFKSMQDNAASRKEVVTLFIYGLALLCLFTMSTLYHLLSFAGAKG